MALVTYTTRPRGGPVHTLALAEALHRTGCPVHVFALGDPDAGFFRPVDAPFTIFPAPAGGDSLEERVFAAADALEAGLAAALPGNFDIVHVQDCIASTAAMELRGRGDLGELVLVRTVHHLDDFTTSALVNCQHRSVLDPDHLLVVSEFWRRALKESYGVEAAVVTNGVDLARFGAGAASQRAALRERAGADGRFLFLTVGGIEPRKGSLHLMEAMAFLKSRMDPSPMLAVVGGHSFQDYAAYREAALARAAALDLEPGRDLVVLGTVPDAEMPGWYRAADAFVFPSVKEGFGLVVLEAMASGLPVVASDIPVFQEFLCGGEALLAAAGDSAALAEAMVLVATDPAERRRLAAAGPAVAARFSWERTARQHLDFYSRVWPRQRF